VAAPQIHLEALVVGDDAVVVVVCECGARVLVHAEPTLLEVLNAIGEHNYERHLRPDNAGMRVRRP
jgi:hypothetical protein